MCEADQSSVKVYACRAICFSSQAVHVEDVSSEETGTFIEALHCVHLFPFVVVPVPSGRTITRASPVLIKNFAAQSKMWRKSASSGSYLHVRPYGLDVSCQKEVCNLHLQLPPASCHLHFLPQQRLTPATVYCFKDKTSSRRHVFSPRNICTRLSNREKCFFLLTISSIDGFVNTCRQSGATPQTWHNYTWGMRRNKESSSELSRPCSGCWFLFRKRSMP